MIYDKSNKTSLTNIFEKAISNKLVLVGVGAITIDKIANAIHSTDAFARVGVNIPNISANLLGVNVGGFLGNCIFMTMTGTILASIIKCVIEVKKCPEKKGSIIAREIINITLTIAGVGTVLYLGVSLLNSASALSFF
jgi:hypothetical protein